MSITEYIAMFADIVTRFIGIIQNFIAGLQE